jgi:hypothetical protein
VVVKFECAVLKEGLLERLEPGAGEGRRGERVRGVAYCEPDAESDVEVGERWDVGCVWWVLDERGFVGGMGIL